MGGSILSRRGLAGALIAVGIAPSARAQDTTDAFAWRRVVGVVWVEILQIPMAALRSSTFAAYHVAASDTEFHEAQARAAEKRAAIEAEISRCNALIAQTPSAPEMAQAWEQGIVDQVVPDQRHALERLAGLAVFLERNSNDYVSGLVPFPAAMRMANWAVFAETDWIMASSTKLDRLGQAPDGFLDLLHRAATLDWLSSSIFRGVVVGIVHGDPPTHISEAQTAVAAIADEMRRISGLFATADRRPLGVAGDARSRVRRVLPRLSALAENQAQALDSAARLWPSLSPAELIAENATFDQAPSFMQAAGPLVGDAGEPT